MQHAHTLSTSSRTPSLAETLWYRNHPPASPFRKFDIETRTARKRELPDHSKTKKLSLASRLLSFKSKSEKAPSIETAVERASRNADDTIGSLCIFAANGGATFNEEEAARFWNNLIKFRRTFTNARERAQQERSPEAANITSASFSLHRATQCTHRFTAKQEREFIAALSRLDFDREINEALAQFAQFVINSENKADVIRRKILPFLSVSTTPHLGEKIAKMDEQQLVSFLKKKWVLVKILQNFRAVILAPEFDCFSELSAMQDLELYDLFEKFSSRDLTRRIAMLRKQCAYTIDIAELLEKRAHEIKEKFVVKIANDFSDCLQEFINKLISTTESISTDIFFDLHSDKWKTACGARLKSLRLALGRYHIISQSAEILRSDSDVTIAIDRVLTKLAALTLPEEQQRFLISKLTLQELFHLQFINYFGTLSPKSSLQDKLDNINRLIRTEIKGRSSTTEGESMKQAKQSARRAAINAAAERIAEELIAIAEDQKSKPKDLDIPAMYSYLHKKAQDEFEQLAKRRVIPHKNLDEGGDYATGLIVLAIEKIASSPNSDSDCLSTIIPRLSSAQLAPVSDNIYKEEWTQWTQ